MPPRLQVRRHRVPDGRQRRSRPRRPHPTITQHIAGRAARAMRARGCVVSPCFWVWVGCMRARIRRAPTTPPLGPATATMTPSTAGPPGAAVARAGGHGLLLLDLDHGCTQDARWDVPREGGRKMGVRGLAQTHAADMNDPSHDVPKSAAKCPHIMIGPHMNIIRTDRGSPSHDTPHVACHGTHVT